MPEPTPAPPRPLVDLIRAKYPGAYDDLSDMELDTKWRAKYPGAYDDLPKPNQIGPDPNRPFQTSTERMISAVGPAIRGAGDLFGANRLLEGIGAVEPGRLTGPEQNPRDAATRSVTMGATAVTGGALIARAIINAGRAAGMSGAAAETLRQAAPFVKYEAAKNLLEYFHVPGADSLAFLFAGGTTGRGELREGIGGGTGGGKAPGGKAPIPRGTETPLPAPFDRYAPSISPSSVAGGPAPAAPGRPTPGAPINLNAAGRVIEPLPTDPMVTPGNAADRQSLLDLGRKVFQQVTATGRKYTDDEIIQMVRDHFKGGATKPPAAVDWVTDTTDPRLPIDEARSILRDRQAAWARNPSAAKAAQDAAHAAQRATPRPQGPQEPAYAPQDFQPPPNVIDRYAPNVSGGQPPQYAPGAMPVPPVVEPYAPNVSGGESSKFAPGAAVIPPGPQVEPYAPNVSAGAPPAYAEGAAVIPPGPQIEPYAPNVSADVSGGERAYAPGAMEIPGLPIAEPHAPNVSAGAPTPEGFAPSAEHIRGPQQAVYAKLPGGQGYGLVDAVTGKPIEPGTTVNVTTRAGRQAMVTVPVPADPVSDLKAIQALVQAGATPSEAATTIAEGNAKRFTELMSTYQKAQATTK